MSLSYDVELVETNSGDTYINLVFQDTVRYTSIVDEAFSLESNEATPVSIPLAAIDVTNDYNSISRTLRLFFSAALEPDTEYALSVEGLINVAGVAVPADTLYFTTDSSGTGVSVPHAEVITVEDHTFHPEAVTTVTGGSGSGITVATPLSVVSSDPSDGSVYLEDDYNTGRVTLVLTDIPSNTYINPDYFKVQRKEIKRGPARWERVEARISHNSTAKEVYIDFPSDDATPTFYPSDGTYFLDNYKYRVRILRGISVS